MKNLVIVARGPWRKASLVNRLWYHCRHWLFVYSSLQWKRLRIYAEPFSL